MSLDQLAAFAVSNKTTTPRKTPMYEMTVEDARSLVKIKNGDRKPNEDGSQSLTLTLGRHTLALDVIAKGASRIKATAEQVEQFTTVLQQGIDEGNFDSEIESAQIKSVPKKKEVAETPEEPSEETTTLSLNKEPTQTPVDDLDIDGLDFSGIE